MRCFNIPTLDMLRQKLGCKEERAGGICWYECNTGALQSAFIFHGVTGSKLDMMPLAERYAGFGYAPYIIDLPGHGGSVLPVLESYSDLDDWFEDVLVQVNRIPDLIIGTSFSSSIVYHALCEGMISPQTKVILSCPTPDMTRLANVLHNLSNMLPQDIGWTVYNLRLSQFIRIAFGLKMWRCDARKWLCESEVRKQKSLTLKNASVLTNLLYDDSPYCVGAPKIYWKNSVVIFGEKDNLVTAKAEGVMRQLLPEARFIRVPRAGHLLHFEAVDSYPNVMLES